MHKNIERNLVLEKVAHTWDMSRLSEDIKMIYKQKVTDILWIRQLVGVHISSVMCKGDREETISHECSAVFVACGHIDCDRRKKSMGCFAINGPKIE